ncbi:hypothetical protein [Pseudomonas sp. UBA6323]|uniref:hypothetical protein n=1 Tax=Pseudomonas sp. UBA6323 TaxID=1947329 RepID=UPI0025F1277E|nr:hypothetical protein [Pseudomonas sp. UBA6323]
MKIISSGFSQYLTPDQPYYIDRDGSKKPYVQIGKTELGSFEAVRNADQLEDQDYGLEFALAVVVDEDPDSLPKERFAVEINVRKTEGRYEFKLRTSVGKRIVKIPESFGEAEQADLYEAILGELIKVLNPARFA